MTRRVLIVYGTEYGHTATIAARIERALAHDGLSVAVVCADTTRHIDPAGFDAVIVGSSVISGKHRRSIDRFVRANAGTLNRLPTAFFSVSGSAGSANVQARSAAQRIMERFLTDRHFAHVAVPVMFADT